MERGPATNPLFGAFLQAVQEAGYPLTDDVNGFRQEGFAKFDRNVYRGRRMSAARAYLHPVMSRKNLEVRTNALVTNVVFEGSRAVGVEYSRFGRGSAHRVDAGEVVLAGGAINSPQLLQLSGVGDPDAAARPGHPGGRRRARRGREPPGPPGGLRAARVHAAGVDAALPREEALGGGRRAVAVPAQRARRHQPLRGGRLRPQQRRRRLPEPDVPLPADRGALRRHRARGRARLPGARRADVLRRPRHLADHQHRPAQAPGAAVQLPVHRPGPPRVGRGAARHPQDPRPARVARVRRRGALPRPGRADRRADPRLGGPRRGDGAAPVRHRRDGHRADGGRRPAHDAACAAPRGCAWWTRR